MGDPRSCDSAALEAKFRNFDEQTVYSEELAAVLDQSSRNFVVHFGPDDAKIARNLQLPDFEALRCWDNDLSYPVRWINFWSTSDQREELDYIGGVYGFTRRLRASITEWDTYRQHITKHRDRAKKEHAKGPRSVASGQDIEKGLRGGSGRPSPSQAASDELEAVNMEEIAYFELVQGSMNFTTVDYGKKFTCIGANWLHLRPSEEAAVGDQRLVPPSHWSWLMLCKSGMFTDTVISIHEKPLLVPPRTTADPERWRRETLRHMRHNIHAVLRQLSAIGIQEADGSALSLKAVRESLKWLNSEPSRSPIPIPGSRVPVAGASNLFYYLFEETSAVVPILKDSRRAVEKLTRRILCSANRSERRPRADIIPELHRLGKELRSLQRLFEGYKTLTQAILAAPRGQDSERIKLDRQAKDRFERLGDRLQLLMLNTINQHLSEVQELSSTYFNLTAQKDSQVTARLNQNATLLAKLSVFFLPISFMTSYYSIQVPHLFDNYTAKTYWITFGVTAGVSFLSLFFFSRLLMVISEHLDALSGRIEGTAHRVFQRRLAKHRPRRGFDGGGDDTDDDEEFR